MTNILHIISDTGIGGGGRSLLSYLQQCHRHRFAPSVIVPRGSALTPRIQALGIPVYEIDALADKSFDLSALLPLVRLIHQIDPQLIHTHGAVIGRIAARIAGRKVVYTKHCAFPPSGLMASPPVRLLRGGVERMLSDGVLAVGHSARDVLVATGIPDSHIHIMYNGVVPLPVPTQNQRLEARTAYGFSPQHFVVGILARVEIYKGYDTILDAVSLLLKQGYPIRLLVAGDGDYLPHLRQVVAQRFPQDIVHFAGFVSDVSQPLYAMDVQVNASYESETSSLSLLEGMSIGLPAVASHCGGNPHLISHGENGLIFPSLDSVALTHCLRQLMDDPQQMSQLSQGAHTIFQSNFTAQRYVTNIEAVYQAVLKGV